MSQDPLNAVAEFRKVVSEFKSIPKPAPQLAKAAEANLMRLAHKMPTFSHLEQILYSGNFVNRTFSSSGHSQCEHALPFICLTDLTSLLKGRRERRPFLTPQSPLYATMEVLLDKGYGKITRNEKYKTYGNNNIFLQHLGEMPIFAKWCKAQDPTLLSNYLAGATLSEQNIYWVLQHRIRLCAKPEILFAVCLQLGQCMAASTPSLNWQGQPIAPSAGKETIRKITKCIECLKQKNLFASPIETTAGWHSGILRNCLLHPAWAKAALGSTPGMELISLCDAPDTHFPGEVLLEQTNLGRSAWEKFPEQLRHLIQQLPNLRRAEKLLAGTRSPLLLSLYLEHPSLQGSLQLDHLSLAIIESLQKNPKEMPRVKQCIAQLHKLKAQIAQSDFYTFAQLGLPIYSMRQALYMAYGSRPPDTSSQSTAWLTHISGPEPLDTSGLSTSWLTHTNRPELFGMLDPKQTKWAVVGYNLPEGILQLEDHGITILPGKWHKLLTSQYGNQILAGYLCAHLVSLATDAPQFTLRNTWILKYDLEKAAVETNMLFGLGKAGKVSSALEIARVLKLSPNCINGLGKPKKSSAQTANGTRQQTLESLVSASDKPTQLAKYQQLGGEFTGLGLQTAIELKKRGNLEEMIKSFPNAPINPSLPLKYLELIENRITPTFLKLVKFAKPKALDILPHLSGHNHHTQDLHLLYDLLLEQSPPQEVFNSLVGASFPLCHYHPDLLLKAVSKGADPTQPIWVFDHKELKSYSLKEMLSDNFQDNNLSQELIQLHKARQQAICSEGGMGEILALEHLGDGCSAAPPKLGYFVQCSGKDG